MSPQYQCVECGNPVDSLYKDYKAGIIKISHCKSCDAVADKYIEYDPVIIFLDALLLQPQAYRHLLINTHIESPWRLALLLWVCDAFIKLVLQRTELARKYSSTEHVNYTYIGLELYLNFIKSAIELFILLASVLLIYEVKRYLQHGNLKPVKRSLTTKAVIIASLGRILAIPALLWEQSYSVVFSWFCQGFVCLSTFQALRVLTQDKNRTLWAGLVVGIGFSLQMLFSTLINQWFEQGYS